MSGSPEHTYMRLNMNTPKSEPLYNTVENLFPKAIEKLINELRSKLPDRVKERLTNFGKLPQPVNRSRTRRDAVRGPREQKIKFRIWDRISPSDQNTIIKTAEEILSSEEKGYAGDDLTVFIENTWPLISDPKMFESFKQREIEDVEQITKSAFDPDEFQRRYGVFLGREKTPTPSTSPRASGKRTRGKKPPANKKKKKRKYFSKKKRKSKTKK